MKINLHFLPEKPVTSCDVVVFHTNMDGKLISVIDTHYCAKYAMFNCHEFSEIDDSYYAFQDGIVAWAYMNEVQEELNNEIQR